MNTLTLKQSNLSPSRSRSANKIATSPRKSTGSPSLLQKKAKISDSAITSKMKNTRQKLCNTLDAYVLIMQTNAPLRCLEHNSILSLYCQTQQKLLCANCVYRSSHHKLHRVFPIQKCYKQIARDVDQMSRQVEREITWSDTAARSIIDYFKQQQKNTNEALMVIAQMYDQIHLELSKAFEQSKRKITSAMDSIFTKKQSLLLELEFFHHIYNKNKPINVEMLQNADASVTENHLIFNHVVGCALIQFGKLDGKIHETTSKIKAVQKHQLAKLNQIKNLVQSWRTQQKQRQSQKHSNN